MVPQQAFGCALCCVPGLCCLLFVVSSILKTSGKKQNNKRYFSDVNQTPVRYWHWNYGYKTKGGCGKTFCGLCWRFAAGWQKLPPGALLAICLRCALTQRIAEHGRGFPCFCPTDIQILSLPSSPPAPASAGAAGALFAIVVGRRHKNQ